MTTTGDHDQKDNTMISKANQALIMLKPVWRAINLCVHTKTKKYRSNVLSVLLYRAECWKTTVTIRQRLETFQTKCHQQILKIYWPDKISNEELRNRTGMDTDINYTNTTVVRTCLPPALQLHHQKSPQMDVSGQEKERTTMGTWQRTLEKDLNIRGLSPNMASRAASDRVRWRTLAVASHARLCKEGE